MYKGIAHLVDNPNELFHSLYWSSSIRIIFSEYTHFINNSEDNGKAIFPSDFIYFYCRKDYTLRNIRDTNNYNNKNSYENSNINDDENNIRVLCYYWFTPDYLEFCMYINRIKEVGKNYTSKFYKY